VHGLAPLLGGRVVVAKRRVVFPNVLLFEGVQPLEEVNGLLRREAGLGMVVEE
jgi:hypothetical protein